MKIPLSSISFYLDIETATHRGEIKVVSTFGRDFNRVWHLTNSEARGRSGRILNLKSASKYNPNKEELW